MSDPAQFDVFDPRAEVAVSQHDLPHWFQPGVATFITFRTADSLPDAVLDLWRREQADWLARNVAEFSEFGAAPQAQPPTTDDKRSDFGETATPQVPPQVEREFQKFRWNRWHGYLDDGHGACLLQRPELAGIVADSLRHFDGLRYDVDSLVVMPNHVHVLAQFRPGILLPKQCGEWLRFSARRINVCLNRRGAFWQPEPFDHLVRTPEQFTYLQSYIADNPVKARLAAGKFLYWRR